MLVLFVTLFMPCAVLASSITSEVILSSDDVTMGETLKATIKLAQGSSEEMVAYEAKLDFDENIFQNIDKSSIATYNGWDLLDYNPTPHTFVVINKYGTTLNEDVMSVKFSLKKDAVPSKTIVGLKNQSIANKENEYKVEDISSKVGVNLISNGNALTKTANFGKDIKTEPVRLYYILTIIVLELIIAIILVLIYYAFSSKVKVRSQKIKVASILVLIEIVSVSALFGFHLEKGDLNSDKLIDSGDVEVLAKHLVNTEMLSNFKLEKADMNGDGKISLIDLSMLIDRGFTRTKYVAKLTDSVMENNSYEKGSTVNIKFLADVTQDEEIEYVLIDGKKYKVSKSDKNKNEYAVALSLSNVSNKYNYNVTEVILANGRSAKVDYDASVVVLKDEPTLSNFAIKEDVEHGEVKVALDIKDPDKAITSSKYELVSASGVVVKSGDLVSGKNSLSLALENAVAYKFKIKIAYNRGADSGEYYGFIDDAYDLKLITDYRFQIGALKLAQGGVHTSELEKNKEVYLDFYSTNISGYAPKKITINNREYGVYSIGNNYYRTKLPNSIMNGTDLNVSKVTLANGKVMSAQGTVSYHILKNAPVVDGIETLEDVLLESMNVKVNYTDSDNSLTGMIVKLFDKDGNFISEGNVNDGYVNLKTGYTSQYIVRVYGNIDRLYGNIRNNVLLYEKKVDAKVRASIDSSKVNNIYPDKNSVIELEYVVNSNYNTNVKNIVINNCIYNVLKVGVNTYKVEVDVGDKAGVKEYAVDKVVFENGLEFAIKNSQNIDVLKDKPYIENFNVEEDLSSGNVTVRFDLYDTDFAFNRGLITLVDKESNEVIEEHEIIPGKNSQVFKLDNAKKYTISIKADATMDTKILNEDTPNIIKDYELYSTEYMLVSDYKLNISSIDTYNSEGVKHEYFEKGSSIHVAFASTNVTEYYPIGVRVNDIIYEVTLGEDVYNFDIEAAKVAGSNSIEIEGIILSNHKEIKTDYIKKIEILKSSPTVDVVEASNTNEKHSLKVILKDEDETIINTKAIVSAQDGSVLYEGALENIEFTSSELEYKLQIVSSFKKADLEEYSFVDEEIYNGTINLNEYLKVEDLKDIEYYLDETLLDSIKLEELTSVKVNLTKGETLETYAVKKYEVMEDHVRIYLDKEEWFFKDNILYNSIVVDLPLSEGIVNLKNESLTE